MNPNASTPYQVYGRKTYPQPLTFIGQLEVEEGSRLEDAARALAGENGWVELIAIPEASITKVIVGGEPL